MLMPCGTQEQYSSLVVSLVLAAHREIRVKFRMKSGSRLSFVAHLYVVVQFGSNSCSDLLDVASFFTFVPGVSAATSNQTSQLRRTS